MATNVGDCKQSQFQSIEGCKNVLMCKFCQVAVCKESCSEHLKSENHGKNLERTDGCIYTKLAKELLCLEEVKSGKIVAFEGEMLVKKRFRVFCQPCGKGFDAKPSIITRHVTSGGHKQSTGAKLSSIDRIIATNSEQIKRNAVHQEDIDCFVCDRVLTRPTRQKLLDHLECAMHRGILSQNQVLDAHLSSFTSSKPFELQREKYKLRQMQNCVARHSYAKIKFDSESNIYKYHCEVCDKMLIGRNKHALDRHANSSTHLRFEKDSDGNTLDEFLYKFFRFLVKG